MANSNVVRLAYVVMSSSSTVESIWDNDDDAIRVWAERFMKNPASNIIVRIMNQPITLGAEQAYRNTLHQKMRQAKGKCQVASQIAFFKKDGTVEVIEHPGREKMEHNTFNTNFAEQLSETFKVIVNVLGKCSYGYDVVDGKAQL